MASFAYLLNSTAKLWTLSGCLLVLVAKASRGGHVSPLSEGGPYIGCARDGGGLWTETEDTEDIW